MQTWKLSIHSKKKERKKNESQTKQMENRKYIDTNMEVQWAMNRQKQF